RQLGGLCPTWTDQRVPQRRRRRLRRRTRQGPVRPDGHRPGQRDDRPASGRHDGHRRGETAGAAGAPAARAGHGTRAEADRRLAERRVNEEPVQILDGNTFVVSNDRGDVEFSRSVPTGLFSYDTRFLSTWVLSINGERLQSMAVDDLQYYEA